MPGWLTVGLRPDPPTMLIEHISQPLKQAWASFGLVLAGGCGI